MIAPLSGDGAIAHLIGGISRQLDLSECTKEEAIQQRAKFAVGSGKWLLVSKKDEGYV